MKKTIYIFGVCCAIALSACSEAKTTEEAKAGEEEVAVEEPEEISIVGNWKMSEIDLGIEIPKGQEATFAALRKDMIDNTKMTYNADGTFTQTDKMEVVRTIKGTYVVDGKSLKTTVDGNEDVMNIASLEANTLVLTMDERGSTMTMTYSR